MPPLLVPFLAASVLLLLAGMAKLRTPAATAQALRTQGLPSSPVLVRLLGAGEVALAGAALVGLPGTALGVAVAYAAFTAFVLLPLLRGRPLSSCGCFGEPDLPPTPVHAVLTALAAACALAVAASGGLTSGGSGLPALLEVDAGLAAAVVGSTALACWLGLLVLTALPRLTAARTPAPAPARQLALDSTHTGLNAGPADAETRPGTSSSTLAPTPVRRPATPRSAHP